MWRCLVSRAKAVFFTSHGQKIREYVASFTPREIELQFADLDLPDGEKIRLLNQAQFCLVHPAFLSDEVLRNARHIKLIQLFSAGYDGINLPLARALGILVANNGGANSISVAEHAMLLILAVLRDLIHQAENARTGKWREYFDKYVTLPPDVERELGLKKVSLEELCRTSDVISIHVPLTSETRHIIGRRELVLMKPSAILVNTSRGGVVDQQALYEALKERRIAGAGLDVLEPEPFDTSHPIFRLDNVTITPHSAGFVFDSYKRRALNAFQNIQRVMSGQEPRWIAQFV